MEIKKKIASKLAEYVISKGAGIIANKLRARGWYLPDADPGIITDVLGTLTSMLGSSDGVLQSLEEVKVCGLPDMITMSARSPRWPADDITYSLANAMPGMDKSSWEEAHRIAWETFGQVCGLNITYNPNYKTAQIAVTVAVIDGPSGTLAWSQLADGTMRQKVQRYDSGERWGMVSSGREVYLPSVIRHEGGHAIGSPHLQQGTQMQPTYSRSIQTFTEGDIDYFRNQLGYGPPKGRDPDEPLPPQPTDKDLFIQLEPGQTLTVSVKK